MRTGTRCTTLVKLPVAFSGGSSENTAPEAGASDDDDEILYVAITIDGTTKRYYRFRSPDDEVFCTDGLCTHEAVHIAEGLVMDYEVECPKHAGAFDYRTGVAKRLPPCVNLRTYPARIEAGTVFVEL